MLGLKAYSPLYLWRQSFSLRLEFILIASLARHLASGTMHLDYIQAGFLALGSQVQLWPSQLHCKYCFTHQAASPASSFLSCFLLPNSLDVSSLVYALSSLPHLVPQPCLGTATTLFSRPHLTSKAMDPVDPELNTHTSQAKNKSSSLLKCCSQVFVTVKRSLTGTAGQAKLPKTNETWSLLLTFPGPCVQTSGLESDSLPGCTLTAMSPPSSASLSKCTPLKFPSFAS